MYSYDHAMEEKGWVIFESALHPDLVAEMKKDVMEWVEICTQYKIKNGVNASGDGTAHQTVGRRDSIDRFYDMHLFHAYISRYFDDKPYILSCSTPTMGCYTAPVYLQKIHRDIRTYIPGYHARMNLIVMLDDFTEENGATQILSGSHHREEEPSKEDFEANCETLKGDAGSVVLFNSYLWHRGGVNRTGQTRVALTSGFTRPFIKPQVDYARMLGEHYGKELSEMTRQLYGYNSRVPLNLDEWYQPETKRLYHPNQE
ncbi:phytanoyl-CoA dioxygenase family protein [Onishia taeanensis]